MSDEVTEADLNRAVARAFGRKSDAADPAMVVRFQEAGFDAEAAQRGAELMESGRFFGFEDVATSMLFSRYDGANRRQHPNVTEASIAQVGQRLAEQAAAGQSTVSEVVRADGSWTRTTRRPDGSVVVENGGPR